MDNKPLTEKQWEKVATRLRRDAEAYTKLAKRIYDSLPDPAEMDSPGSGDDMADGCYFDAWDFISHAKKAMQDAVAEIEQAAKYLHHETE